MNSRGDLFRGHGPLTALVVVRVGLLAFYSTGFRFLNALSIKSSEP